MWGDRRSPAVNITAALVDTAGIAGKAGPVYVQKTEGSLGQPVYHSQVSRQELTYSPQLSLQELFLEENRGSYEAMAGNLFKSIQNNSYYQNIQNNRYQNIHSNEVWNSVELYPVKLINHAESSKMPEEQGQNPKIGHSPMQISLQELFLEQNRSSYHSVVNRNSYNPILYHIQESGKNISARLTGKDTLAIRASDRFERQRQDDGYREASFIQPLVYGSSQEAAEQEIKEQSEEILKVQKEIEEDVTYIRETRMVMEQINKEYERWREAQSADGASAGTKSAESQKQMSREIFEHVQLAGNDASISQITGQFTAGLRKIKVRER